MSQSSPARDLLKMQAALLLMGTITILSLGYTGAGGSMKAAQGSARATAATPAPTSEHWTDRYLRYGEKLARAVAIAGAL